MKADRAQKVAEVVGSALDLEPQRWPAFLDDVCAGDASLRAEVESLLQLQDAARDFIEAPVLPFAVELLEDESEPIEGELVGSYKVICRIGRGGMGDVYLAARADDQYQKQVAIKLIKRGFDTEEIRRRFRHERQILATLDHPNIARLLDGGTTSDGRPYFVMEYVDGVPLHHYCDHLRLNITERLKLFRTVCAAVHYAHQHLVIHRDIKPSNILVTEEGVPKLLDFGIAKLLNPELTQTAGHTVTELRVMTPEYASPEQIRGESVTTATDIYSLGVLLYELLTGHRPYRVKSRRPAELERAICEEEPERPSTVVNRTDEIPGAGGQSPLTVTPESVGEARSERAESLRRHLAGDLDNIVLMAMRKEQERRYASVERLSEDIRRYLDGLPVRARKDTFSYRSGKFIKRHKAGVAAALLVTLILIAGVVAITWEARVAALQRDRALAEKSKAERASAFLYSVLLSPDPSWNSPGSKSGREVSLDQMLDEASRRAQTELADQPEILAAVEKTIGISYRGRGRYALAEEHLRAALDIYRKLYGEEHPDVVGGIYTLAQCLFLEGKYDEAEPLYRKALDYYRKAAARSDDAKTVAILAGTLNDLAYLLRLKGEPQESESLLREALSYAPRWKGNERALVAIHLGHLGLAREDQGDMDGAEALERQSIDEFHKLPGGERMELGTVLINLGGILMAKGDYTQAKTQIRAGLDIYHRLLGEDHPYLALGLNQLGYLLYLKGDYAGAEENVKKAIEIQKQMLPEYHPSTAYTLTTLGLILNRTGKAIEAEKFLRQALEIRTRVMRKEHWLIAKTKLALGECLTIQKRYQEAEPILLESYESLSNSLGEASPDTKLALKQLVSLYENWGKSDRAAEYRNKL